MSWPKVITCEMNIAGWESALLKANLLEKYSNVLTGFRKELAKEDITANFQRELEAGRMFGPFSHETVAHHFSFFQSSPLGEVVNSDGSVRPINDLSFLYNQPSIPSVNSFVDKDDFSTTWDDFNTVASFFRNNTHQLQLSLFDWEKASRQIPTAIPTSGCGSFGRPADAWKEIMIAEFDLVHVFRWVDDNLFVKTTDSTTSMADIVHRSLQLGVKTNKKKYSEFTNKQKFIGFLWDGTNGALK
ncbi:hypothetical protein PSTG_10952 [Puccinia striiformis f. sp. tritici PST-78]|uniref:Reverse transcriptase domain-containing protein n=1 Tax=Puccinia striiformis f. sp. tritici PST-78 TaxID=1165861 RepID=A0A0L0V8X0_9BASI|nr:hypothetical protein PSTG_10952 [Puccinia striiformis f. sp. tritici PST-78]